MLKRRIKPRGDEIEIFVPEDQAERDLLAGIVNHHIPERYNVMAVEVCEQCGWTGLYTSHDPVTLGAIFDTDCEKCDGSGEEWPEYVAFGLMLTEARMSGTYEGDAIGIRGLMGLYFRAYVTTDPESRILIDLVIEDNDKKHLEAICEMVNSKHPFDRTWAADGVLSLPAKFMFSVNEGMNADPDKRTEWVQI